MDKNNNKTFAEVGKLLLVSFLSILISVFATRRALLDKKLDKEEYEKDQEKRWQAHDKVQAKNDEMNRNTYLMVKYLYEKEKGY